MARALIMLVRLLGLAAIVLGTLLWGGRAALRDPHIGIGFLVALVVFVMAVLALMRKAVLPGILGVVLAFLLPLVGLAQLPIISGGLRAVQVAHIVIALITIGVAERLYSAIQKV